MSDFKLSEDDDLLRSVAQDVSVASSPQFAAQDVPDDMPQTVPVAASLPQPVAQNVPAANAAQNDPAASLPQIVAQNVPIGADVVSLLLNAVTRVGELAANVSTQSSVQSDNGDIAPRIRTRRPQQPQLQPPSQPQLQSPQQPLQQPPQQPQPPPPPPPPPPANYPIPELADIHRQFLAAPASFAAVPSLASSISAANVELGNINTAERAAKANNLEITHIRMPKLASENNVETLADIKYLGDRSLKKVSENASTIRKLVDGMNKMTSDDKFADYVMTNITSARDELAAAALIIEQGAAAAARAADAELSLANKRVDALNAEVKASAQNIALKQKRITELHTKVKDALDEEEDVLDALETHMIGRIPNSIKTLNRPKILVDSLLVLVDISRRIGDAHGETVAASLASDSTLNDIMPKVDRFDAIDTCDDVIDSRKADLKAIDDLLNASIKNSEDALGEVDAAKAAIESADAKYHELCAEADRLYVIATAYDPRTDDAQQSKATAILNLREKVIAEVRAANAAADVRTVDSHIQKIRALIDDYKANEKVGGSSENLLKYQIAKFAGMLEGKPSAEDFIFVFSDVVRDYAKLAAGSPDGDKWAISALVPKALPWAQANMNPREFERFMVEWSKFKKIEGDHATK